MTAQKSEEVPMAGARCSCGKLTLKLPGRPNFVVACHCIDCQRRTGAPYGVGAFYPVDTVDVFGNWRKFARDAASGGRVHSYFCPNCGSTVYWKADNLPPLIGVAIGALVDFECPAPFKSIFERSKRDWVQIDGDVEHYQRSSTSTR
jgi:hypothetical protein